MYSLQEKTLLVKLIHQLEKGYILIVIYESFSKKEISKHKDNKSQQCTFLI